LVFRLLDQYGIPPDRIGDLTYPQVVAIITRGNPDGLSKERWQAKRVLADFAAGKLKWRD
jgi:hypothetical protein